MRSRIEAGAAVGALFLALAALAFSQNWCQIIGWGFLACGACAVLAAFANRIPVLHRLPGIGEPRLNAELTIDGRKKPVFRMKKDSFPEFLICLGIANESRQDIDLGHVNFLVSEGIVRHKCDHHGYPDEANGRWMCPTFELIGEDDPTPFKDYWSESRSFPGENSVVWWFRIRVHRPGHYRFRLKINSSVLFKEFLKDFEITVDELVGEKTTVEELDVLIDIGNSLVAALDEAESEEDYLGKITTFVGAGRMAIPEDYIDLYDGARGDWTGMPAGREYARSEARAKGRVLCEIRRRLSE